MVVEVLRPRGHARFNSYRIEYWEDLPVCGSAEKGLYAKIPGEMLYFFYLKSLKKKLMGGMLDGFSGVLCRLSGALFGF